MNWTVPATAGVVVEVSVSVAPPTCGLAGVTARVVFVGVGGGVVVYESGRDDEVLKALESVGAKSAVKECEPTAGVTVVVATPVPGSVMLLPTVVLPSLKVTVPGAAGVVVDVRVTIVPPGCGLCGLAVNVVVVSVGAPVPVMV